MQLEHHESALLQLHHHSRLNTWLQWIGQRQLQDERSIFSVLGFEAPYIRGFTVYSVLMKCLQQAVNSIKISWNDRCAFWNSLVFDAIRQVMPQVNIVEITHVSVGEKCRKIGISRVFIKVYDYYIHRISKAFIWTSFELTHLGRESMASICHTTFSNTVSWMKMSEFCLRFRWNWFPRFQLTISQHLFKYWLGADQAISHYLKQRLLMYIRVTEPNAE